MASYEYKSSMQEKGSRNYVANQPMNSDLPPTEKFEKVANAICIRDDGNQSSRLEKVSDQLKNEEYPAIKERKVLSSLKQTTVMSQAHDYSVNQDRNHSPLLNHQRRQMIIENQKSTTNKRRHEKNLYGQTDYSTLITGSVSITHR